MRPRRKHLPGGMSAVDPSQMTGDPSQDSWVRTAGPNPSVVPETYAPVPRYPKRVRRRSGLAVVRR